MDVTQEAALKALMRLANDTEMQLFHAKAKNGPLMHIMLAARAQAVDALQGLALVDPADIEKVRKLQNEVHRFNDLLGWMVAILAGGDEAFQQLQASEGEVKEVRALIRSQIEQGDDE